MLVVRSERGKTYQLDLKTRSVTQSNPVSSPSPEAVHEITEQVQSAITNGSLAKKYEVAFRLNPFYLRGDFNGDGEIDVAVLVKQRSTGKVGIAIVYGGTNKVTILGAGTAIGNGGDDFEWMDTCQIYSITRVAPGGDVTNLTHFHGHELVVR